MKESKLYLTFFKKNLTYFLIAWLLFGTLGLLYQLQKPVQYTTAITLEMPHTDENILQKVPQVQEAVTLARSTGVQQQVGAGPITVYNNSPLTLVIQSTAESGQNSSVSANRMSWYLINKFGLNEVGDDLHSQVYPNYFFGSVMGLAIGTLLVVSVLLIRSYVQEF
jgi:hypothetical protein